MKSLDTYIAERKIRDEEFAHNFESGYQDFKIGVLLKRAREESGLTREQLARKLNTKKTAISYIENNAHDIKLSTLKRFARAIGKNLTVEVA